MVNKGIVTDSDTEKELKKCPFCGGEAELYEQKHKQYPSTYYVRCKGFCIKQMEYKDKDRAIIAWNRRVADG